MEITILMSSINQPTNRTPVGAQPEGPVIDISVPIKPKSVFLILKGEVLKQGD